MEIIKLDATKRTQAGKAIARRLRRDGQVPAVAYGKGLETLTIAVSPKGLQSVLASAHGKNTVVEIGVQGEQPITALLREFDVHPISRDILHADFLQIQLNEPVEVEVPFVLKGKPAGVVLGGVLRQVFRRLPIRCLPEQVPVSIEHDVTPLNLGEAVKTSQLSLPEGVRVTLPPERTVASVVAPEKDRGEEGAAKPAEGAAAAAPAAAGGDKKAAAPAAGGDKKAAAPAAGGDKKAAPAAGKK